MTRIGVIGAGAWGTTLADLFARRGEQVTVWAYETPVVESINRDHTNPQFLPGAALSGALRADADLDSVVRGADVLVCATPSHVVRDVFTRVAANASPRQLVVSVAKGLEPERLNTISCVLGEVLPAGTAVAVLSGPSFAREVFDRQPTAVVAAGRDRALAERVQRLFATPYFRVYSHTDILGVELAGALKNVIALAAGILDGLGLGNNTRAALITRGLAEITRLGIALGAEAATFAGLAGMGDLILTATGALSRNRTLGVELGKGRGVTEALAARVSVAEGVNTARAAVMLGQRHRVELPIAEQVSLVLFQGKSPRQAVSDLMERELKSEQWGEGGGADS